MTDLSDVVCAVTLPGLAHLAPVLLMRDGTYRIAPDLPRQHRPLAERWIKRAGPRFRAANRDLLDGVR